MLKPFVDIGIGIGIGIDIGLKLATYRHLKPGNTYSKNKPPVQLAFMAQAPKQLEVQCTY